MAPAPLCRVSVTSPATHDQTGPLWCWFPSGWACARPRPLWVSPMTSPVRLGVSPAAPPGAFSIRGLRLYFPALEPWVAQSALLPAVGPGLSVCECGATGSASGWTACPFRPTLHQSRVRHGNSSPLHPGCPFPPLLPVWMNVSFLSTWCRTSLLFDFMSVLVVR